MNLQGHCRPRKAVPLETALYWEEQGAEGRGGSGGLENKVDSRDPWRKIKVAEIFSVKKQNSLELSWKECEG